MRQVQQLLLANQVGCGVREPRAGVDGDRLPARHSSRQDGERIVTLPDWFPKPSWGGMALPQVVSPTAEPLQWAGASPRPL